MHIKIKIQRCEPVEKEESYDRERCEDIYEQTMILSVAHIFDLKKVIDAFNDAVSWPSFDSVESAEKYLIDNDEPGNVRSE